MPDPDTSVIPTLSADREALLTQLVAGPSITEVATHALQPALDKLYPHLKIDPRLAVVVTPTWMFDGPLVSPGPRHFESLTDALVHHGVAGTSAVYLDGETFLTHQPEDPQPAQLPVSIDAIARLINELAPLLFVAFQEQQVDYWNQFSRSSVARWKALSNSLSEFWDVQKSPGWDSDQTAMAHNLFLYPEKSARALLDPYRSRACLIDLDSMHGDVSTHGNILDVAVLIGSLDNRTLILTHNITSGFQAYDSLQELGDSLLNYVSGVKSGATLQWRLIEPEGNYFDHLACNLIGLQAEAIGALKNDRKTANPDLAPHISRTQSQLDPTDKQAPSRFNQVEQALPDWMASASSADLTAYSRHLMDLATVRQQNGERSFLDGIQPIREYAQDVLRRAMIEQHADASTLDLADIEVVVESVVVWGSFVPLVEPERTTLSLVDLALQNLTALPAGNKSVRNRHGTSLPQWMTPAYLEALITKVNIGQVYPELIKNTLLGAPLERLRRQNLFTSHLRVELPLRALQQKIRQQAGIDELGYRYVAAVVQAVDAKRRVDGQEIVIRPLAFKPGWRPGGSSDEVTNMFVIGPRQMDQGPCLLYRPLLDQPLSQYPTPANLIYAIKHAPGLRQSVLAWLPDAARANYTNYIFTGDRPNVWSLSQMLADPLGALQLSGPLTLGSQIISGDYLTHLYKSNVNALVEMAQRQSLSNAQNRWNTFKRASWMLLNAALPFLGRTVGTAAWIWQVLDDVQQTLDAGESGDREQQKTAMTDLLLTLAMVLAHHASSRKPATLPIEKKPAPSKATQLREQSPAPAPILVQQPDIVGEHPPQHRLAIETDVVLNLHNTLERFSLTPPEPFTSAANGSGIYRHLHQHAQRYYAAIGERWFEVAVADTGDVTIIDSRQQPVRRGPALIHNKTGTWFVDTRLRLRGGGLPSRRKALQQQNRLRIADLKKQLLDFEDQRALTRTALTDAHDTLKNTVDDTAVLAARAQFLEKLDRGTREYTAPIEQLKSLNLLDTVPNYRSVMVEMLGEQLFLNQTWIDQRQPLFTQTLRETLVLLEEENRLPSPEELATFRSMVDLCEEMIGKLEFAQSRFLELGRMGKTGAEIASTYRARLPDFKPHDLKALQVSLARATCLKETSSTPNEAENLLERLLDSTDLVIQTSQELMQETGGWKIDDRLEGLNDLLEQFTTIDQSLEDLALHHTDALHDQPFQHLRMRINEFREESESYLAQLLREQQSREPRPGPSRPAPQSKKRVIKTRYKGTVVGELRPQVTGQPTLLDVKAPLTGTVIATFHEKSPGVWLEHLSPGTRRPAVKLPDLATQLTQGRTLLNGVDDFVRQTEASARKPGRIPVEIEEQFQQKAEQLHEAAKNLQQTQTDNNSIDEPASLITELNDARARLNAEGYRIRVDMLKRQPPTAARIEWLLGKHEIDIVTVGTRRRLKGSRKDFLQEYEIRERRNGQALWYAHFHYASAEAAREAFTAAHLKLSDQRLLAGPFDVRTASSAQMIAVYRSVISPQLASALFFS